MKLVARILFLSLLVSSFAAVAVAQDLPARGDDANRPSKNGRVEGQIDGVKVVVTYGRPVVKGRTIWGDLVPYGEVWRAGANEATHIWFSDDVLVNGQKLAAGTYTFWTVPGESEWTVIFNSATGIWGRPYRAQDTEVLRVKTSPRATDHVEALDYVIEGNRLVLRWEKLAVPVEIKAAN